MLINIMFNDKKRTITFKRDMSLRSLERSFFFLIPRKEFIILSNHIYL